MRRISPVARGPELPEPRLGTEEAPQAPKPEGSSVTDRGSAPADDRTFSVDWPFPGDELLRWELGHPEQGLPLRSDLMRVECGACFRRMAVLGGPCEEQRLEQFHGYGYIYERYADSEAVQRWRENPPAFLLAGAKNPLATWR